MLVTGGGGTTALTVVPAWGTGVVGSAASVAGLAGDKLLVVGDAQKQGADLPPMKYSQRVLGFNYTQIHRTVWNFSGTAAAIEHVRRTRAGQGGRAEARSSTSASSSTTPSSAPATSSTPAATTSPDPRVG